MKGGTTSMGADAKIVFLHGISDGDPERSWLKALNGALVAAGYEEVPDGRVIAPRYAGYLSTDGVSAKLPGHTYRTTDEALARRQFERRQAEIGRQLRRTRGVQPFGFHRIADGAIDFVFAAGVKFTPYADVPQVRRYIEQEPLRGAIIRYILDQLPPDGEIVLVAHSLGSLVAIDLLNCLPPDLRIRRFVTIGSPAGSPALHRGGDRLIRKFPYAHVADWTNIFSVRDAVTRGRGLASLFSPAQDFAVDIGALAHASTHYLSQPAIAGLIGEALFPSKAIVHTRGDVTVHMTDADVITLIKLHYAWAVRDHIKDAAVAARYGDALNLVQDDLIATLKMAVEAGKALPVEWHSLIEGGLPPVPHRIELGESIMLLTSLSAVNFIEPFEVDVGDAPKRALGDMVVQLGFRRNVADKIAVALTEIDSLLRRSGGIPWGRIGLTAASVALLAAGPVGFAAAPALGVSVLGGAGAAAAAMAFVGDGDEAEDLSLYVTQLSLQVAADYALSLLDLGDGSELWTKLTSIESRIAAELNRLEPYSDPKSTRIVQLRSARESVKKLITFIIDKRLGAAEPDG
jgi:hypothetical protein